MREGERATSSRRWKRWMGVPLAAAIASVFGWHCYLSSQLSDRWQEIAAESGNELSVNPLTNLIAVTIAMPPEVDENPFGALAYAFSAAMAPGAAEALARECREQARQERDVYAMLIPYRVSFTPVPAKPKAVKRLQEERVQGRAEQARRAAEQEAADARKNGEQLGAIRSYAASSMVLENVHVSMSERWGEQVPAVFGTVVNRGDRTIRETKVRVYFLEKDGRRIGEQDFYPVLVTEFGVRNNAPLRPGYRKDFGYKLDAPSGWARRVEAEIADLEFEASPSASAWSNGETPHTDRVALHREANIPAPSPLMRRVRATILEARKQQFEERVQHAHETWLPSKPATVQVEGATIAMNASGWPAIDSANAQQDKPAKLYRLLFREDMDALWHTSESESGGIQYTDPTVGAGFTYEPSTGAVK